MKDYRISFGNIWNYLSEDTGNVIDKGHPCILITDEISGKAIAFTFTHDKYYGIEGKEERYVAVTAPEISNTRIKNEEELEATWNYYYEIYNNPKNDFATRKEAKQIFDKARIGYLCKHPIENNKSYLEQEVPTFESRFDFKFSHRITETKSNNDMFYEQVKINKTKFIKFLPLVEKALINNNLNKYEAKIKDINGFLDIESQKFSPEERLNIAWKVNNEINFQKNTSKSTELEYVERIKNMIETKGSKVFEISFLNEYIDKLKIKDLEHKIEIIDSKISKLEKTKSEIVFKLDIERYSKVKEMISELSSEKTKLNQELSDLKEQFENKDKKIENDNPIDTKIEDNDNPE